MNIYFISYDRKPKIITSLDETLKHKLSHLKAKSSVKFEITPFKTVSE